MERRSVAGDSHESADLIGVAVEGADANAQVFQVRDGILAERHGFYLANEGERDEAEVAEEFVAQYYSAAPLGAAAGRRRRGAARAGRRCSPRRSRRSAAARSRSAPPSAATSAACASSPSATPSWRSPRTGCAASAAASSASTRSPSSRRRSRWSALPVRIEGFDISNLGAEHTVASMVVFEGGAPKKSDYRRFRIRGDRAGGPDDFSSIEEVLEPAPGALLEQADLSPHDAERDESFAAMPDLIVIDGGKGQLVGRDAGARAAGRDAGGEVAVIGLAKRLEEVFVPGRSRPLPIPRDSEALRLLQRVRDEAHRFAIDLHRGRRDQAMTASLLDELRGVGPVRKRALLKHFGSPERLSAPAARRSRPFPASRQARPRHPPPAEQGRMRRRIAGAPVRATSTSSSSPATREPASRRRSPPSRTGGYFCVDNLPPRMIGALGELFRHEGSGVRRAAVVSDVRGGEYFEGLARGARGAGGRRSRPEGAVPRGQRGDPARPLQGDPPPPSARARRAGDRGDPRRARAAGAAARARRPGHGHLRPHRARCCAGGSRPRCSGPRARRSWR